MKASFRLFLIVNWLVICKVASSLDVSPRRYRTNTGGAIALNDSISSELSTLTHVAWTAECFLTCQQRGCAIVNIQEQDSRCELVFINNCSKSPGPLGSHVTRNIGVAGVTWIAEDLDEILQSRRQANGTTLILNSATGRNGSVQRLLINVTGCYRIEAFGAAGGSNNLTNTVGGKGAFAAGSFHLAGGVELSIVVGQAGGPGSSQLTGAGGGGGSFVYQNWSRLILAAGGGGGASSKSDGVPGQGGPNGADSSGSVGSNIGFGGINGQPGYSDLAEAGSSYIGGCGAGWLRAPDNSKRTAEDGEAGGGYADGWLGGVAGDGSSGDGGFGGGGGAAGDGGINTKKGSAGAAGGFSGGGAGVGFAHSGGGGGSVCGEGSVDCVTTAGGNLNSLQGRVFVRLLRPSVSC